MNCCIQKCSYLGPKTHYKPISNMPATIVDRLKEQKLFIPGSTHMCEKHRKILDPSGFQEKVKENICVFEPSYMFELPNRDVTPETFGDLEGLPDFHDFIIDLFYLKVHFKQRIGTYLKSWCFAENLNTVMFFLLEPSDIPTVYVSIKLDIFLKATVTLDGRVMDPRDMTCLIPITGRITRWSQLEKILNHYAKKVVKCSRKFLPLTLPRDD